MLALAYGGSVHLAIGVVSVSSSSRPLKGTLVVVVVGVGVSSSSL